MQPLADGNGFEQFLPFFERQIQIRGDQVRKMSRMLRVQRGDFHLIGQRSGHLGYFLELLVRIAKHRLEFDGIFRFIAEQFVSCAQKRRGWHVFFQADAPETLDEHSYRAVRKFYHFRQTRDAADFVQIFWIWLGDLGFALQHRAKKAVTSDDVVNELEALPGLDEKRHNSSGKNNDV